MKYQTIILRITSVVSLCHERLTYMLLPLWTRLGCIDVSGKDSGESSYLSRMGGKGLQLRATISERVAMWNKALTLMGLSLPVEPDDLKRRYRELAKQYHPDLNPGDPQSQERMKALT